MLYVYEFEVFESEGSLLAFPFDFGGGTQGDTEKEIAEMAADWLRVDIEHRLIHGIALPEATFGNKPKHGGRILLVAIEVSLDTIDAVAAHEAADMLGVSRGRITQMVSSGVLEGFRKGRDAYVTVDSIEARLADTPTAGRPRKELAKA
ncbi:MAG: helix-turn-helix domain-containing protein [Coriobacteriia bacterium]|nr:helix-turn-helix domain-containing protein [Coriobacteriia bacterium]